VGNAPCGACTLVGTAPSGFCTLMIKGMMIGNASTPADPYMRYRIKAVIDDVNGSAPNDDQRSST